MLLFGGLLLTVVVLMQNYAAAISLLEEARRILPEGSAHLSAVLNDLSLYLKLSEVMLLVQLYLSLINL